MIKSCVKYITAFFLCAGLTSVSAQELIKLWETDGFVTPESILYDSTRDYLYVSNIGSGDSKAKNGEGFISTMDKEGKILEMKWADGLNSPKGMTLYKEYLLVTDIDKIVFINRETGKVVKSIYEKNAVFLNDLITTPKDEVLVSDSRTGTYYILMEDHLEEYRVDKSFINPNGLDLSNGVVYAGVGDRIVKFTSKEPGWEDVVKETGKVDGICKINKTSFLISAWTGQVYIAYTDKQKKLLLDTSSEKTNTADFYFDKKTNKIYIPTFFGNKVMCYQLEY